MGTPTRSQRAARRAAGRFVRREGLTPPIDIEAVLLGYANEVARVDWPFHDVDAVTYGLGTDSVRVFLRHSAFERRERFTIAHELAHILIPWHTGQPEACHIGEAQLDSESTTENEADIFASCVLLPDSWLDSLYVKHNADMSSILSELTVAHVSTPAALLALRRHGLAGWGFYRSRGEQYFSTPGTQFTYPRHSLDELRARADAHGTALLNNETITWFRFFAPHSDLPERGRGDIRSAHSILIDALEPVRPADSIRKIVNQLNGIIGGSLKDHAGQAAKSTYPATLHRISGKPDLKDLVALPGVQLWVAEKARAIEAGTTNNRKRRR